MRPRVVAAVLVALALSAAATGCGDDDAPAACGADVRERLAAGSEQHVLPGGDPPTYETHPPTSGAHQLGEWPTGVLDEPLSEPVQVALLEEGEVLVQYDGIAADDRDTLEALARDVDHVTVAPNPDLPAPVVATAWTHKQTCDDVDVDALRRFAEAHAGKGA